MIEINIDRGIGPWEEDFSLEDLKSSIDGKDNEDLNILLNSNGGSVYEGFRIFNALKNHKGKITVTINVIAASAATYIALAADNIKVYKNSVFMIHNPMSIIFGYFTSKELKAESYVLDNLGNIIAELYSEKSNTPIDIISQMLDDETYLFGEDIITKGFANELIDFDDIKEQDSMGSKEDIINKNDIISNIRNNMYNANKRLSNGKNNADNGADVANILALYQNKKECNNVEKQQVEEETKITAKDNALDKDTIVNQERERITAIMALNGSAEITNKAIEDGLSAGDAAINILASQKEVINKEKAEFEAEVVEAVNTKDTIVEGTDEKLEAMSKQQAESNNEKYALNKKMGGF